MTTFQNKNLAVIAYANGATIWHYRDPKLEFEDINLDTFFQPMYNLCEIGDKINIVCKDLYFEAVVVRLHHGDVICRILSQVEFTNSKEED